MASPEGTQPTIREVAALGDVVIVISDKGRSGVALVTHGDEIRRLPYTVDVTYAKPPAEPLTIQRITIKGGWTDKEWKAAIDGE